MYDARHNSSTARDIEHALAWTGPNELNEYRSPGPKYSGHQFALIHLRRAAGDLPLSLLIHLMLLKLSLQDMLVHNRDCQRRVV